MCRAESHFIDKEHASKEITVQRQSRFHVPSNVFCAVLAVSLQFWVIDCPRGFLSVSYSHLVPPEAEATLGLVRGVDK